MDFKEFFIKCKNGKYHRALIHWSDIDGLKELETKETLLIYREHYAGFRGRLKTRVCVVCVKGTFEENAARLRGDRQ